MAVRLVVYTGLLFASWQFDLLGIPDGQFWTRSEPRAGYTGSESHLTLYRLTEPGLHPLHPLLVGPDARTQTYRSQFGLPGVVLGLVQTGFGLSPGWFAPVAAGGFALLAALVVGGVFAAAHRVLGPPTGDVACVLAAASPVFLPFAPSLYWALFALLLPFALVWCGLPRANTPGRRAVLVAAVGAAVGVKCLCGYEYITAVVAAPVAAAWFHQHRAGESGGRRLRLAAGLVAAGLAGFGGAMAVHAAQIELVLGEGGVAAIRDRAAARTTGELGAEAPGDVRPGEARWRHAARCFTSYFDQRAVCGPAVFGPWRADVPLRWVVVAVGTLAVAAAVAGRRLPREAVGLAGAAALALAAGVSWQVLAVNHMCIHRHLNLVVYAVPFLPVAFVVIGYTLRLGLGPAVGRWVGPVVLAAAVGTMVATVVTAGRDGVAGADEQAAAEAAVGRVLGGEPMAGGPTGVVAQARPAGEVPPGLLVEFGVFDVTARGAADPAAVFVQGWAAAEAGPGGRSTARVVVACGGAVVPCRVVRFRRPDLEAVAGGRPLPGAGFVAVVPSAAVAGGPVRVFAVASADPARVTELSVPR